MSVSFVPKSEFQTFVDEAELLRAANAIREASAIIVMAGAGFGADSGIDTYRTNEDFFNAHPQLRQYGLGIPDMSNVNLFRENPRLAWGFMASRLELYRSTSPHDGYATLKRWAESMPEGYFVYTSNVDGHFVRAGFSSEKIVDRHGSLENLQCVNTAISRQVWKAPDPFPVRYDKENLLASHPLPTFTNRTHARVNAENTNVDSLYTKVDISGGILAADQQIYEFSSDLARPNMRLFNDDQWINDQALRKERDFHDFVNNLVYKQLNYVIIEIGVGLTVDTVRPTTEKLVELSGERCTLVRINPIEPEVTDNRRHVSIKMTGLQALREIDKYLIKSIP